MLKLCYEERFATFSFIAKDFINNDNCEYAYRLKNHLYDRVEKAKSDNVDLHLENVGVKALVEYVFNNYVGILKENKIDFKVEAHDAAEIYSDRNALENIILNLLSNAFKYTPCNCHIHLEVS